MEVCVSGCTQFEDSITWEWSIGWDQHWAFSILYSASEWFCTTATECRDFKVLHLTGRCYNHRTTATIEIELSDILQTPHLSHVKCSLLVICWLHSRVFIVQCQQLVLTSFKCELPFHGLPATGLRQLQSEIWTKLPSSFFKRRESTMWYVEWVSPQEHKSESVRRRPFLQSPQWPCAVWNQFSRDHCCRERSKPSCRIVGSATKWKLMTDIQLSPPPPRMFDISDIVLPQWLPICETKWWKVENICLNCPVVVSRHLVNSLLATAILRRVCGSILARTICRGVDSAGVCQRSAALWSSVLSKKTLRGSDYLQLKWPREYLLQLNAEVVTLWYAYYYSSSKSKIQWWNCFLITCRKQFVSSQYSTLEIVVNSGSAASQQERSWRHSARV